MARCPLLAQVWGQIPDVLAVEPSRDMAALGQQIEASQGDDSELGGAEEGGTPGDAQHAPVRWVSSLPGAGPGLAGDHERRNSSRLAPHFP